MTPPHVIEIETLDLSLQDIIEAAHNEPLVLTREGKPVYVVRSLLDDDLADDLIALHPDFIDSIKQARQQKLTGDTKTLAEIRAEYTKSER